MSIDAPTTKDAGQSARYKYQRLRERLRRAIAAGELTGKLPGERELARRYEANAKTVNKALSDLTTEGLLVRHVGRGTFVANGHAGAATTTLKAASFGWLGLDTRTCPIAEGAFRGAAEMIREKGHQLEWLKSCPQQDDEIPPSFLLPATVRNLTGIILHRVRPSLGFLAELNRRHLPVVLADCSHERARTASVTPDYADAAFELTEHLLQLGHRRIGLLIHERLLPTARRANGSYKVALRRRGLAPRDALIVGDAFEWSLILQGPDRPTALICVGAELACEASRRALEVGLVTPAAMSVCAVPEPGSPLLQDRSITTYEVGLDNIVERAVELALTASPGQPPQTVIIPGELVDRGSAAPPGDASSDEPISAPGLAQY